MIDDKETNEAMLILAMKHLSVAMKGLTDDLGNDPETVGELLAAANYASRGGLLSVAEALRSLVARRDVHDMPNSLRQIWRSLTDGHPVVQEHMPPGDMRSAMGAQEYVAEALAYSYDTQQDGRDAMTLVPDIVGCLVSAQRIAGLIPGLDSIVDSLIASRTEPYTLSMDLKALLHETPKTYAIPASSIHSPSEYRGMRRPGAIRPTRLPTADPLPSNPAVIVTNPNDTVMRLLRENLADTAGVYSTEDEVPWDSLTGSVIVWPGTVALLKTVSALTFPSMYMPYPFSVDGVAPARMPVETARATEDWSNAMSGIYQGPVEGMASMVVFSVRVEQAVCCSTRRALASATLAVWRDDAGRAHFENWLSKRAGDSLK